MNDRKMIVGRKNHFRASSGKNHPSAWWLQGVPDKQRRQENGRQWRRAAGRPRFRARHGPQFEPGSVLDRAERVERSHSVRRQKRGVHCVGGDDRYGWCQGKRSVVSTPTRRAGRWAAAVPSVSDCGTGRNSEQVRESDPGTAVASDPRNALQNEGQALSRLAEGRPPRVWRGADWVPHRPAGLLAMWH